MSEARAASVSRVSTGLVCIQIQCSWNATRTGMAYLLLSNHPFTTKLPRTTSAWVLLMFDLGLMALSSRRAARDETENDSCGASMICSIYLANFVNAGDVA
jgi:hypothetical protein